jgi:hypothetical protein
MARNYKLPAKSIGFARGLYVRESG